MVIDDSFKVTHSNIYHLTHMSTHVKSLCLACMQLKSQVLYFISQHHLPVYHSLCFFVMSRTWKGWGQQALHLNLKHLILYLDFIPTIVTILINNHT